MECWNNGIDKVLNERVTFGYKKNLQHSVGLWHIFRLCGLKFLSPYIFYL
jgi:hypothetical protein